jgi:hypothetical protein
MLRLFLNLMKWEEKAPPTGRIPVTRFERFYVGNLLMCNSFVVYKSRDLTNSRLLLEHRFLKLIAKIVNHQILNETIHSSCILLDTQALTQELPLVCSVKNALAHIV